MARMKRFTDLLIGFYSDGALLTHPSKLRNFESYCSSEELEVANRCHIYLILSRPRATYVAGSIAYDGESLRGTLKYNDCEAVSEVDFALSLPAGIVVGPLKYPFNNLDVYRGDEIWFSMPAYAMSFYANLSNEELRNIEVQYVGMSYADGKRSAKDRLISHSTLQAVMADMSSDYPDKEVLLLLQEFAPPQIMMLMNSGAPGATIEDDRDVAADLKRAQEDISEDLQIALIEAGLIKYFQPSYNEKYKQKFPHYTHKILKELYAIDFGSLSVEINTEHLNFRIFSQSRKPGSHHTAAFDLHDPKTSSSFYNMFNLEDGPNADTFSGPRY